MLNQERGDENENLSGEVPLGNPGDAGGVLLTMASEGVAREQEGMSTSLGSGTRDDWMGVAEKLYKKRSHDHRTNIIVVRHIFEENEVMFSPLVEQCPGLDVVLSFILANKFSFRVKNIDRKSKMTEWGEEECKRVGCSLATFLRKRKTGEVALDAWRLHFTQLDVLFEKVQGFEDFMNIIANNTLRDSIYGMVMRVSVGAALSITDAVTDIYTISTYYKSEELYGQANALLVMLLVNILMQLIVVIGQYRRKKWLVKVKEVLITVLFLRPAVDAYRISTNQENDELTMDSLSEMICNKGSELAFESIPGCILQLYVWLSAPDKTGTYALVSIAISCLTTGFTSAMIAFDMDVDVPHRKKQPNFYGYIPNENGVRGRCFMLMTLISALHNLSRSIGCALLALSDTNNLLLMFVGGEIGIYLLLKILRQDFYSWMRLSGVLAVVVSFATRIAVKIIVDFSGCIHFRHPYELGGLGYLLSVIWSQVFPFVALHFVDGENKAGLTVFLVVSLMVWVVLNTIFFCTIDLSYLNTFFGTKTAPQYTCELFMTSKDDYQKFRAVFKNRIEYTKSIHREVEEWVAENLGEWRRERPEWFNIEMIPDEFLPEDVLQAEGGAKRRRRSSVSLREMVGVRSQLSEE